MNWITLVASVLLGLAVNEVFDLSPWAARKVVLVAARVWTADPERQATYAEEWQALIAERPGSLSKLLTAAGLLGAGLVKRTWTMLEDQAVLGWVSLTLPLRSGYSRQRAAPPSSVPREQLPRRVGRLRQALWAGSDLPGVVATARTVAARTRDPRERSEVLMITALGLHNIGSFDELAEALERTRNTLRDVHNPRLLSHVDVLAALAAARSGRHRCSIAALAAAVPRLVTADDNYETVFVWHDLAAASSYVGLHDDAARALQHVVVISQRIGLPEGHLANPGIHLRRALSYDHQGDTERSIRLLRCLVEEYRAYKADGVLERMRNTARASYGYAMARLAAMQGGPSSDAHRLLKSAATSELGRNMLVLGSACLAVAAGRVDEALARLDAHTCDSTLRLGREEPHRVRALALRAGAEPGAARAAEQHSRNTTRADHATPQQPFLAIPNPGSIGASS